jgi:hypothetical protein
MPKPGFGLRYLTTQNRQSSAQRKQGGTGDPSLKFILNEVKGSGQALGRGTGKMDNEQCRMDNFPRSGSKGVRGTLR